MQRVLTLPGASPPPLRQPPYRDSDVLPVRKIDRKIMNIDGIFREKPMKISAL
jgi:hypothetical protein